jgi:hypothetical protein
MWDAEYTLKRTAFICRTLMVGAKFPLGPLLIICQTSVFEVYWKWKKMHLYVPDNISNNFNVNLNHQTKVPCRSRCGTFVCWLVIICHTQQFFVYMSWGWLVFIGGRENPDTLYNVFEERPSATKLTNFLTQSHRYEQDTNRRGPEVRGFVV